MDDSVTITLPALKLTDHAALWWHRKRLRRPLALLLASIVCFAVFGGVWIVRLHSGRHPIPFQRSFSTYEPKPLTVQHYAPPRYFSVATLSLGGKQHAEAVQPIALQAFAKRVLPDILVVQDAPSSYELELIDQVLPQYDRIRYSPLTTSKRSSRDEWTFEANVFFNLNVWTVVEHGTHQFGSQDDDERTPRHLFWVRLETQVTKSQWNASSQSTSFIQKNESVLIATVSLSPAGSKREINSAKNVRIRESDAIVDILRRIERQNVQDAVLSSMGPLHPQEAMILAGDMGDSFSAKTLFASVGLFDPFSFLHMPLEPTFPTLHGASPTVLSTIAPSTRDWIFSNDRVRPMAASVMKPLSPNDVVSSHAPVLAVYELLPCGLKCALEYQE